MRIGREEKQKDAGEKGEEEGGGEGGERGEEAEALEEKGEGEREEGGGVGGEEGEHGLGRTRTKSEGARRVLFTFTNVEGRFLRVISRG